MKQPEDVHLSREEGEALLARLEANALDRRGSARVGEGADLLLLVAVCVAGSEAESQTVEGAGVWREAQEARAPVVGRDAQRWEWRRERTADEDGASQGVQAPLRLLRRPRRSPARRGMGGRGRTCIGRRRRWRVAMRN